MIERGGVLLHIAVCDDERTMLNHLKQLVYDFFHKKRIVTVISLFSSGEELLQSGQEMDILFLDIQMKRIDGMKTAQKLRERGCKAEIIFITILKEMVFCSFEVRAFDYLIKPVQRKDFDHTLERLMDSMEKAELDKLLIQIGNENHIIRFDEILYCEVIDRKIYLHLDTGNELEYYDRMDDLAEKLDNRFYRCHRSYLINLQYLESYKKGYACMEGGHMVPVSRLRSKDFSHVVLRFMKEWRI